MKVRYDTPLGGYIIAEATMERWEEDPAPRVVLRVTASECFIPVGTVMPFIGDEEVLYSFEGLLRREGWSEVGKSRGSVHDDDSNYTNAMAEHLINEHNDEEAAQMINQGIVTASYIHDSNYPDCTFEVR